VVAHLARAAFGITNIVVRNYDPAFRSMHEAFDHQIISSSSWGAQRIEELLYHAEIRTVFSAGNGEIEIYEFAIPAVWENKRLEELLPSNYCTPVSLTRAGTAFIPDDITILKQGDILLVSATFDGIETVRNHLKNPGEN
jgi:trk system potassium uptake protein TrkA